MEDVVELVSICRFSHLCGRSTTFLMLVITYIGLIIRWQAHIHTHTQCHAASMFVLLLFCFVLFRFHYRPSIVVRN